MKSIFRKIFKTLCLSLILCSLIITPVLAANAKEPVTNYSSVNNQNGPKIKIVTPEEMDQLIALHEAGIEPYNWFPDYVAVTYSNEGSYCKVVFMNVGFPFDRCDITGSIKLNNSRGMIVASQAVAEYKLIYGVARVIKIYPSGGSYSTGTYSLRLSDGDIGTLYTGTF